MASIFANYNFKNSDLSIKIWFKKNLWLLIETFFQKLWRKTVLMETGARSQAMGARVLRAGERPDLLEEPVKGKTEKNSDTTEEASTIQAKSIK